MASKSTRGWFVPAALVLAVGATAVLVFVLPALTGKGEPYVIRVGYATLTPIHCAIGEIFVHTDILRKHGFKQAEFTPFVHGSDQHEYCDKGVIDATFVCEVPTLIHLGKLPGLMLVGSPGRIGDIALVVPAGSSVDSMADLRGKTLAVQEGSSAMLMVEQWMAEERLRDSASIRIQEVRGDGQEAMDALVKGAVEAAVFWDPWLAKYRSQHDLKVVKSVPFYSKIALYDDHASVSDPARYMAAVEEALAWGAAHMDEVVAWVSERSGISPEVIRAVLLKNEFLSGEKKIDLSFTPEVLERLRACEQYAVRKKLAPADLELDERIKKWPR